jgi:D-alanyl-lipoteichoic acid acyltransferase DltB (MBOAT superfamily)
MLFNSLQFLVFYPIVVIVYFNLPHRWRWLWLLVTSYYFYMSWEPVYGLLLFATTFVDYLIAIGLSRTQAPPARWRLLSVSLVANLGMLFFFKYYDFVAESLNGLFAWLGLAVHITTLNLVLPIGISFYTLQSLAYTIDVFRRRMEAEPHLGMFMLYVSFFPQLVAGPIERAQNLLPQLHQEHSFDERRASDGLKLMVWGFFKKLVIADNLAFYVEPVFANPDDYTGWAVLIAAYFFAFQVYCDFSGYSDIAIGTARILGVELMENFRRPFLSRSIREFWQRWHISLTTWFRDYVYYPMGGSRVSPRRTDANILTVFIISGLWHGAQWTYVIWGFLNGLFYLVATKIRLPRFISKAKPLQPFYALLAIFFTFNLFALTLIFFRANTVSDAFQLFNQLLHIGQSEVSMSGRYTINFGNLSVPVSMFIPLIALMGIELLQERGIVISRLVSQQPGWMRWTVYYLVVMIIVIFGSYTEETMFIYFQF